MYLKKEIGLLLFQFNCKTKIMRFKILIVAVFSIIISSCNVTPELKGKLSGTDFKKIYLGEIKSEYYKTYNIIDSAEIVNGEFRFDLTNKKPQLYFLGNGTLVGKVFIEQSKINVTGGLVKDEYNRDVIEWKVEGSGLHAKLDFYNHKKDSIAQQKKMNELSKKFYEAREKEDRETMKMIKDEQIAIMDHTRPIVDNLNTNTISANMDNAFGLYLYYTTKYARKEFKTIESIEKEREHLTEFGPEVQKSAYALKIEKSLKKYENCAIGKVAPELFGADTTGTVKSLSNFRGKYVIVDFWSSGCKWCRYETPNLLKTYNEFKDKGFTVLGVSSDWKKEMWMKAIHEDESYWDQILLAKKDIGSVMDEYCIRGIPHIILIDPEGKILEKDLRGEDIYNGVAKYMDK